MTTAPAVQYLIAPEDALFVAVCVGNNGSYGARDRISYFPHKMCGEQYDGFTLRMAQINRAIC